MPQQNLRYGASENDGTGDPFRVFAEKAESNFSELYREVEKLIEGADPDIDTLAKVAEVIHSFNAKVDAVPSASAIYRSIADAADAVAALVPTPAQVQTSIANAIAAAVATQLAIIAAGPVVSVNGQTGAVTVAGISPGQAQAIADHTTAIASLTEAKTTQAASIVSLTSALAEAKRLASLAIALGG